MFLFINIKRRIFRRTETIYYPFFQTYDFGLKHICFLCSIYLSPFLALNARFFPFSRFKAYSASEECLRTLMNVPSSVREFECSFLLENGCKVGFCLRNVHDLEQEPQPKSQNVCWVGKRQVVAAGPSSRPTEQTWAYQRTIDRKPTTQRLNRTTGVKEHYIKNELRWKTDQ